MGSNPAAPTNFYSRSNSKLRNKAEPSRAGPDWLPTPFPRRETAFSRVSRLAGRPAGRIRCKSASFWNPRLRLCYGIESATNFGVKAGSRPALISIHQDPPWHLFSPVFHEVRRTRAIGSGITLFSNGAQRSLGSAGGTGGEGGRAAARTGRGAGTAMTAAGARAGP